LPVVGFNGLMLIHQKISGAKTLILPVYEKMDIATIGNPLGDGSLLATLFVKLVILSL